MPSSPVFRAALTQANITLNDLDAIGVTSGPGLAGALLAGITYAKALAFAQDIPLIAVNHLEGHIHAVLLNERESLDSRSPLDDEPALVQHGNPPRRAVFLFANQDRRTTAAAGRSAL